MYKTISSLTQNYRRILFVSLRLALGVIFVWFGLLKIMGYNPVFDLIYHSMIPMLAYGKGLIALGAFETAVGTLLLLNKFIRLTHLVLFLHLLGTFSTLIYGWEVIFDPYFPVLSLSGEFVVKNIVLVIAGLVVLVHESHARRVHS